MNRQTDALSVDEKRMKQTAGINQAITNTVILLFDLVMLFVAAFMYQQGQISFDGVMIPTIALMSSFGPVVALAALGSTLQNTFAAGNRVLDILDEIPVVEEVTGKQEISFEGASIEEVSFAYHARKNRKGISFHACTRRPVHGLRHRAAVTASLLRFGGPDRH